MRYFFQSYLFLNFVLRGVTRLDLVYLAGLTVWKLDEETLSRFLIILTELFLVFKRIALDYMLGARGVDVVMNKHNPMILF